MDFQPAHIVDSLRKRPFYLLPSKDKLAVYSCMVDFCVCYSSEIRYVQREACSCPRGVVTARRILMLWRLRLQRDIGCEPGCNRQARETKASQGARSQDQVEGRAHGVEP